MSVANERFCLSREFVYSILKNLAEDFNNRYNVDPMSSPK